MPVRRVGGGPAKISKAHQPLKSFPVKTDLEKFRPTSLFVPDPIVQSLPIPGPSHDSPVKTGLKPSRSVPTLLDEHPDSRPRGTLIASRSNPVLSRPTLEAPQPEPDSISVALTSTSTSRTNAPGLRSEQTLLLSPLLDNRSTQPSPKVEKQGFFSRLFGFGRSQSEGSREPRSARRLSKSPGPSRPVSTAFMTPAARPISDPKIRPVSVAIPDSTQLFPTATFNSRDFSTRPAAVAASNTTTEPAIIGTPHISQRNSFTMPEPIPQEIPPAESASRIKQDTLFKSTNPRRHAVLVKKPPSARPTKHGRQYSSLTHPSLPSPDQYPGHIRYNSYPQTTHPRSQTSFESPVSDPTTVADVKNDATSSDRPDSQNHIHANTATSPGYITGQTNIEHNPPHGPRYVPHVAADHTQYVAHDKSWNLSTGYTYGDYPGARNPVYQPPFTNPDTLCTVCKTNPRYLHPDTGMASPYCSDACQETATVAIQQTQKVTCKYPGCTYPAVMYPADHYWNYCGESHERLAREGCIYCRQADGSGTQLCKGCSEGFRQRAPTVIPVPMDHDVFWNVVDRFTASWARPTQCPVVQAVYKVVSTQHSLDMYLTHRDTLEYYGRFTAQGKLTGNERILWHGARRACSLGETGRTTPCMVPRCSLCSMIRGSSGAGKSPTNLLTGRLGTGIYTTTKSSRANEYSSNDKGISTPWKALLLNTVAAGHECAMGYDDTMLTAPPEGYDSVYGEVGGSLNYDELVVYTNEAVRPTWLVMYKQ